MEVRLKSASTKWTCKVFLRFETDMYDQPVEVIREQPFGEALTSPDEVEGILRRAQLAILNPSVRDSSVFLKLSDADVLRAKEGTDEYRVPGATSEQLSFSENLVCLDISGPSITDLAFLDLPGIISNSEQPGDIALIENMLRKSITGNCLILLTITMRDDYQNQKAVLMAKEADPQGKRIIGVLTKADTVQAGEHDTWIELLTGHKHRLTNGYFCTKQPSPEQLKQNLSFAHARALERDFFKAEAPWNTLEHDAKKRLGVGKLTEFLSDRLGKFIEEKLPTIQSDLGASLQSVLDALKALPPAPSADPTGELLARIGHLTISLDALSAGRDGKLDLLQQKKLNDAAFAEAIKSTRPELVPFEASEPQKIRNCKQDHPSWVEGPALVHKGNLQDPFVLKRTLDEVRMHIQLHKGRELPYNVPYGSLTKLMELAITAWPAITTEALERLRRPVTRAVEGVVKQYFGEASNAELRSKTAMVISDVLAKIFEKAQLRLDDILELEGSPFTLNEPYFASSRDGVLADYKEARQVKLIDPSSEAVVKVLAALTEAGIVGVEAEDLSKLQKSDDFEEELDAMAQTVAYWTRIIDNIPRVLDYTVIRPLGAVIQNELLARLTGDEASVKRLLAEEEDVASERQELNLRRQRLEDAKRVLIGFGRDFFEGGGTGPGSLEVHKDSRSPLMHPTSLSTSPSAPLGSTSLDRSAHSTAPVPRAKVRRTYGRKVEVDETVHEQDEPATKTLKRQSTTIVPETDPDAPNGTTLSSEDDIVDRRKPSVASSSPTRQVVHSTDPTSEDEEEAGRKKDEDRSASEDGDDKFAAFLKRGAKDLLADVDRDFDERVDDPLPTPAATRPTVSSAAPALADTAFSSSLPHLTTSAASSSSQATPLASHRHSAYRPASPSSGSILEDIEAFLPPVASGSATDDAAPTYRSKKTVGRIADSEDEDATEPAPQPSRKGKQRAVPDSSDREEDDEGDTMMSPGCAFAPTTAPPTAASRKEKLAALALKKRKDMPAGEEKRLSIFEDADDMIEGDDEAGGSKRRGGRKAPRKSKVRGLSKKAEEEMNRQTAAFARTAAARLEPTRKSAFSVTDVLKNQKNPTYLPTPPVTNPNQHPIGAVTLSSSSDTIVTTSPVPAGTQQFLIGKTHLTQRDSSPINDLAATPVPVRTRVPRPPPGYVNKRIEKKQEEPAEEEDDDELLSLDQMAEQQKKKDALARVAQAKAAKKKLLQEQKLAAVRATKTAKVAKAKAADSDSDIEIEGAPGGKPPSSSTKQADAFDLVKAGGPRRNSHLNKVLRQYAHVDTAHAAEEEEPTESQFEAAGKEFGRNLVPKQHHVPSPARQTKKRSSRRPAGAPILSITREALGASLMTRAHEQAHATRLKKQTRHRKEQDAASAGNQVELEGVNVEELLAKKKQQAQEEDAEEEDADGDYQDEDENDEMASGEGSGSDDEMFALESSSQTVDGGVRASKIGGEGGEDDEGELDSDGELRMPPSSQNSDRHGGAMLGDGEEDDETPSQMPPPATKGKKKRLIFDEEEDEDSQATTSASTSAPAPTEIVSSALAAPPALPVEGAGKVTLGGLFGGIDTGGDGGFSQFFDSQFSQDAAGDGALTDGFLRPAQDDYAAPAATMFAAQPLISTAERAADAARLEARGGFNNFEPETPREAPAARQYINDQGLLTQTRPANLFADSPSDSPASFSFRQSLSTRASETQLAGDAPMQTPTQTSKNPTKLRRQGALTSFSALATTEMQALLGTAAVSQPNGDLAETQEEETQEAMPSAAQPQTLAAKNAFDALRAGATQANAPAPAPAAAPKRPAKSAFINDQAGMDDEDEGGGLGGVSADEDEEGHDDELESLVDNEEVHEEVRAEQDALAEELHAAEMEKRDEAALKRAEGIAAGKERNKRRGGDLSDDEWYDDFVGNKNLPKKRPRVDDTTTAGLAAKEETQPFAAVLREACDPTSKQSALDFLREPSVCDEDDEAAMSDDAAYQDPFGSRNPTFREAQEIALQRQKRRDEEEEDEAMASEGEKSDNGYLADPQLRGSSSPVVPLKLNNRTTTTTRVSNTQVDEYDAIDSQNSLTHRKSLHSEIQYAVGDSRTDSTSATVANGRSTVTGFSSRRGAGKTGTSAAVSAKRKRTELGAKKSTLGMLRSEARFT
ncbi:hypothetical protein JCM11641_005771 [Rhodosporidiobolus odoratus]